MTDHRFVSTLDGWDPRTLTFLDYTGPMMWRHTCSVCGKNMTDPEMLADGNKYDGRHFTRDCPGRTAWDLVNSDDLV
jgi:hypothetical protein